MATPDKPKRAVSRNIEATGKRRLRLMLSEYDAPTRSYRGSADLTIRFTARTRGEIRRLFEALTAVVESREWMDGDRTADQPRDVVARDASLPA